MCGFFCFRQTLQGLTMLAVMLVLASTALTADPGTAASASAIISDHKPGSVLFYNFYSSNSPATSPVEDTRISLTNTGGAATIRMFFVNGANGTVKSEYFCPGANQSISFEASQFDPGVSGYIVAVAVDGATGCPVSHNFLIGDAYLKLTNGSFGRLKAVAAAANFSGALSTCTSGAGTAAINFDGSATGYNRVARTVAIDNMPSRADGNQTFLILNRIGGNLATGVNSIGPVSSTVFDDSANDLSFNVELPATQFRSELTNDFPPIFPRLETLIPAGRSGWLKVSSLSDVGILGATLNFNSNSFVQASAFNTASNLSYLTLATSASYTMPVSVPNCTNRPVLGSLNPGSARLGQSGFVLTVRGYNFLNGASIQLNGSSKNTAFVSSTELRTTLAAADLAAAGTVGVTVSNPSGAPSNMLRLTVAFEDELIVDDGTFEDGIGVSGGGTLYAVNRLTPSTYPATLSAVAIYFRNTGGVRVGDQITVLAGVNQSGNANISGQTFLQTSAQIQGLGRFNVYNVAPLTITSGDFVVGMRIVHPANTLPMAEDFTPPSKRRSYYSSNGSTFTVIDDFGSNFAGNFGIRARLSPPVVQCSYDISPASQSFTSAAGTGSVSVTAGSGCNWTAVSNAAWLTISSGASGSGNGTVAYSVAANTTSAARTGMLTIAGKTFTVTQAGPVVMPAITSLNPATVMAGSFGALVIVNGMNFVNGATVRVGANNRATTFANATQLLAAVLASDIATPGTVAITVVNPAPNSGTSNSVNLTIVPLANVSAASFLSNALAPDSIVAMFGLNLATGVASAASVPLPTVLLGTRVRVRDSSGAERDAPLFFVAPSQINYLVPAGTSDGTATVTVTINTVVAGVGTMLVAKVIPGLFSANASGQGVASGVAIRVLATGQQRFEPISMLDAQQRYVPIPIDLGPAGEEVYLSFYGTGFRANGGLSNVKMTIGGTDLPVSYASLAPGFTGLDQLNAGPIPRNLTGRGVVNVMLTVDGKVANTVQVSIK